jgi:glucose dehydrogenase
VARLLDRPGRGDACRSREHDGLGKPIGANSSLDSWEGDQWQIGGGTTWGWYSYDPSSILSTTAPATLDLEPRAAPGDNKWSMTLMARDPTTGWPSGSTR